MINLPGLVKNSLKLNYVHTKRDKLQEASAIVYGYKSMSNRFPSFIAHWILNFVDQPPTKTMKIGTPRIKVISEYALVLLLNGLVVSEINNFQISFLSGSMLNFL